MYRALVVSKSGEPLMPCSTARAREMLQKKRAKMVRRFPFVIRIDKDPGGGQLLELKVDPGSRTTGVAVVGNFQKGRKAVFAMNLKHKGTMIGDLLGKRRSLRRNRRARKTRYRKPRFLNRAKPKGWLPPSLKSRIDNVINWARKLMGFAPVTSILVEDVRFDTQKMQDPEISGVQYQQGELHGYEVREYLLEKWGRKCVYCDKAGVPLQVEHINPRSKGGSSRVSNLTISCKGCNQKKGNMPVRDFVKDKSRLKRVLSKCKEPLADVAAVNSTRKEIKRRLEGLGLPLSSWSGGRTKFNRVSQGYQKDHWIDAVCVGESGVKVHIPEELTFLVVKAEGRGSRQMCRVDKFGFPRTRAKKFKRVHGFRTGDLVLAVVTKGKKVGRYFGKVAVRATGSFNVRADGKTIQGLSHRFMNLVQRADGFSYAR